MLGLLAQSTEAVKAVAEVVRDAQHVADLPWYERIIEKYGFTGAFTIVVCFVTWRLALAIKAVIIKYGPIIIEACLDHIRSVNDGLSAIASAVNNSSDTQTKQGEKIHSTQGQTNQAVLSLSRAAKEACQQLPEDTRRHVIPHLDEVEKALGGK